MTLQAWIIDQATKWKFRLGNQFSLKVHWLSSGGESEEGGENKD